MAAKHCSNDILRIKSASEMEMIMKLKKKLALCILFGILSVSTFAGCSKSDDAKQTDADNTVSDLHNTFGSTTSGQQNTPVPSAPEQPDDPGSTANTDKAELSDTIRWFNASYAILTELNGCNYNIFGGMMPNAPVARMQQQMLENSWGVTDRASADETLDWLLTEGHRLTFVDDMAYLEQAGLGEVAKEGRMDFILSNFDVSEEDAGFFISCYAIYEQYGAEAIDAWDYCRALNLMGFFYLAGYYDETEALDTSLEIAKVLQAKFNSWDALVDSYLRGYEYWAEESSDERREIYEDLKTREDNPYSVDYNTELTKTW